VGEEFQINQEDIIITDENGNFLNIDVTKRKLEEIYTFKEEHLIKKGAIILKNTPLKNNKVYIEFNNNDKILQIETRGKKEISIPDEFKNYKDIVYCTYKYKDWVDIVEIKADDIKGDDN